jgi:hypothetical protein
MIACARSVVLALVLLVGSAPSSAVEDVAGAWTMSYTTRDGVRMSSTLTLKTEAGVLSGTISSPRGSVPLDEISVKGDQIAFAVIRVGFGDRIRIDYTGTVKDDTMKLKMKAGAREPLDVTARRSGKP